MKQLNKAYDLYTLLENAIDTEEDFHVAREVRIIQEEVQHLICRLETYQPNSMNLEVIDETLNGLRKQFEETQLFNKN